MKYLVNPKVYRIDFEDLNEAAKDWLCEVCDSETGAIENMTYTEALEEGVFGLYKSDKLNALILFDVDKMLIKFLNVLNGVGKTKKHLDEYYYINCNNKNMAKCNTFEGCAFFSFCDKTCEKCGMLGRSLNICIIESGMLDHDENAILFCSYFGQLTILDIMELFYVRCGNIFKDLTDITFTFNGLNHTGGHSLMGHAFHIKMTPEIHNFMVKYLTLKG